MIRVLMSPIAGRNPYARLLVDHLPADVDVEEFSWPRAFLGRYDVLHVHWPERLFSSRSLLRTSLTAVRLLAMLALVRLRRQCLVWTAHEAAPHDDLGRTDRALVHMIQRRADRIVTLSEAHAEELRRGHRPVDVVRHGHFGPIVGPLLPQSGSVSDMPLVASFGLMRPYKGFASLIEAANGLEVLCRVVIAGPPVDVEHVDELVELAADVPSVELRCYDLDEPELVELVASSAAVVLPYRVIQNSGSALYSLSCGTPVLVTASPSIRELAAEVGDNWLVPIEGHLDAAQLESFLHVVLSQGRGTGIRPAMHPEREWPAVGEAQARCYRACVASRPARRTRRRTRAA